MLFKINPMNVFAIAAHKDNEYKIKLPNYLLTFDENFHAFKLLWMNIEHNLDLQIRNNEYCCHFHFSTVCAELSV